MGLWLALHGQEFRRFNTPPVMDISESTLLTTRQRSNQILWCSTLTSLLRIVFTTGLFTLGANWTVTFQECLIINGTQYCIYFESGWNKPPLLEMFCQGSHLSSLQKSLNVAMSSVRITLKWWFKEVKIKSTAVDFKPMLRVKESPFGVQGRVEYSWYLCLPSEVPSLERRKQEFI